MRGNLSFDVMQPQPLRSIPAHAGQPPELARRLPWSKVYPRACGATRRRNGMCRCSPGLSPRMRGNRYVERRRGHQGRSIPAHAGQPSRPGYRTATETVYPRACGATENCGRMHSAPHGLSPRMRGNRPQSRSRPRSAGSIPAHAGQPELVSSQMNNRRVYPRACGATYDCFHPSTRCRGLSPRMRGNHDVHEKELALVRSIPAHAGQPARAAKVHQARWVYPRACGATFVAAAARSPATGLSPRMRGNRLCPYLPAPIRRSIPAHAGQPKRGNIGHCGRRVYPRACGATHLPDGRGNIPGGLSPRMRGNRYISRKALIDIRSIPAHAGQPQIFVQDFLHRQVYPRACGATGL